MNDRACAGSLLAHELAHVLVASGTRFGRSPRRPAIVRNVLGGAIAMGLTCGIGSLIGVSGIG